MCSPFTRILPKYQLSKALFHYFFQNRFLALFRLGMEEGGFWMQFIWNLKNENKSLLLFCILYFIDNQCLELVRQNNINLKIYSDLSHYFLDAKLGHNKLIFINAQHTVFFIIKLLLTGILYFYIRNFFFLH